MEKEKGPIRKS